MQKTLKILVASSVAFVLLSGCSSAPPKFAPHDLLKNKEKHKSINIESVISKLGKEKTRRKRYITNRFLAELAASSGKPNYEYEYEFTSSLSLDNRIEVMADADNGSVSYIRLVNPKSPRTLEEVKSAWGQPHADGESSDGTFFIRYEFESSKDGKIGVTVATRDRSSNLITWIRWW